MPDFLQPGIFFAFDQQLKPPDGGYVKLMLDRKDYFF